jgi:PilZ domain
MSRSTARTEQGALQDVGQWEREYEALLEQALAGGGVERLPAGQDRRAHPRFRLRANTIGVQLEAQFPVLDMSADGVSFRSPLAMPAGHSLNLVLGKAFLVAVDVVDCEAARAGPQAAQWPWLVHCRFTNAGDGKRLLVMLNAMQELELQAGPH